MAMSGYFAPERLTKAERRELQQFKMKSRKTEKELRRKEKAIAEAAAALLILEKKPSPSGGRRERMIIPEDRQMSIELNNEVGQCRSTPTQGM